MQDQGNRRVVESAGGYLHPGAPHNRSRQIARAACCGDLLGYPGVTAVRCWSRSPGAADPGIPGGVQ